MRRSPTLDGERLRQEAQDAEYDKAGEESGGRIAEGGDSGVVVNIALLCHPAAVSKHARHAHGKGESYLGDCGEPDVRIPNFAEIRLQVEVQALACAGAG